MEVEAEPLYTIKYVLNFIEVGVKTRVRFGFGSFLFDLVAKSLIYEKMISHLSVSHYLFFVLLARR